MRTGPRDLVEPAGAERGIVDAVRDLAGAGLSLATNTARLAACEARATARRLVARVIALAAAAILASMGVLLVLGGLATLAADALDLPLWSAFLVVGLLVAGGGAFVALRAFRALGSVDLGFPGTLAELEADAAALRKGSERR